MKPSTRPCVLYANDNQDMCDQLTKQLARSGLEVKAARTVGEAVWLARAEQFDLYLLDTRFADDDGFELCRRMRAFDARTPILFFSGGAYDAGKRKVSGARAAAYIVKRDLRAFLVATVFQLVARRRGQKKYSPPRVVTRPRRSNSSAAVLSMATYRVERSGVE